MARRKKNTTTAATIGTIAAVAAAGAVVYFGVVKPRAEKKKKAKKPAPLPPAPSPATEDDWGFTDRIAAMEDPTEDFPYRIYATAPPVGFGLPGQEVFYFAILANDTDVHKSNRNYDGIFEAADAATDYIANFLVP